MKTAWRSTIALAILAAALGVAAYSNALQGPFVFDDAHEIVTNESIEDLSQPLTIIRHNITRPLTNVSYAIDYAVWSGRNRFGFHLTNLLIHLLNVLLLFVVVKGLARDAKVSARAAPLIAFSSAALLAVHPVMTEAVSYISSRSDLLATAFVLGSLLAFQRGIAGTQAWLWTSAALCVGAIASKETGAAVPFLLLASDVLIEEASGWRARLRTFHGPLIAAVCAGAFVRVWRFATSELRGFDSGYLWSNALTSIYVPLRYVSLLVFPHDQTIVPSVYPITSMFGLRFVSSVAGLLVIAAIAVAARKRAPLVTLGIVWFCLGLLPSTLLNLISPTRQFMAEHRIYLSSCGFFLATAAVMVALVEGVPRWFERIAFVAGAALLVVLVTLTMGRNRIWADEFALWEEAARLAPDTPAAQLGLADQYQVRGECSAAEPLYRRALELDPTSVDTYVGLTGCLVRRNAIGEAARLLETGISRVPASDTRIRLALASLKGSALGQPIEALRLCEQALAIEPASQRALDCVARYRRR